MYCTLNPRLFEPFQSRNKKIEPKLSDDWEIIPESYNSSKDITVYSKKLGVKVSGFHVYKFLEFLKTYNVELKGLKIKGTFIPGQDRKLYSEEDYKKWIDKYNKLVEGKINLKQVNESKIGKKYVFKCGAEYYFIGFVKIRGKKVRVFGNSDGSAFGFEILKKGDKLSKELDEVASNDKLEFLWAKICESWYSEIRNGEIQIGDFKYEKWYDKELGVLDNRFFDKDNFINFKTHNDISVSFILKNKKQIKSWELRDMIYKHIYKGKLPFVERYFYLDFNLIDNKIVWRVIENSYNITDEIRNNKIYQEIMEKYKDYTPLWFDGYYIKKNLTKS